MFCNYHQLFKIKLTFSDSSHNFTIKKSVLKSEKISDSYVICAHSNLYRINPSIQILIQILNII